jgi:TP901 family phage tail tape measure protein
MGRLASSLGIATGVGALATGLGVAAKRASDFGDAMAEVATLLPDGVQRMGELRSSVRDMALEFGKQPQEQARALYEIISSGASDAAQAQQILTAANKLAKGGITDVDTAADGLTSTLASYGLKAAEATRVSDAFFVSAAAGKTTIGELASNIGLVAPLAANMGVTIEELTGAVGALTKGGLSTSEAFTGVRSILTAVAQGAKESKDMAEALGVNFSVAGIKAQGFAGWLADIGKKAGGSVENLSGLFGRVEGLNAALALTGKQAESFAEVLADMETKAGRTDKAIATIDLLSPGVKFAKLKTLITTGLIDIGDKMLNVLVPAAVTLTENFGKVESGARTLGEVLGVTGLLFVVGKLTLAVIELYKALRLLAVFVEMLGWVQALQGGFVALAGALAPFLVGGAILVGLALFAKALYDIHEQNRIAKESTESLTKAVQGLSRAQIAATIQNYDLALAMARTKLQEYEAEHSIATAAGFYSSERLKLMQTVKELKGQQAALQGAWWNAPTVVPPVGGTGTGTGTGGTGTGGTGGVASGLTAAEEAAKRLQEFMQGVTQRANDLKTNYDLVADGQSNVTGLAKEYLAVLGLINSALARQKNPLGETATALRKMKADVQNTFTPAGMADIAKQISERTGKAIDTAIMAPVLKAGAVTPQQAAYEIDNMRPKSVLEMAAAAAEATRSLGELTDYDKQEIATKERLIQRSEALAGAMSSLGNAAANAIVNFAQARGLFGKNGGGALASLGSQIGGAALGKLVGGSLGKLAGTALGGPLVGALGSVLGGIAGNLAGKLGGAIGGLFGFGKKKPEPPAVSALITGLGFDSTKAASMAALQVERTKLQKQLSGTKDLAKRIELEGRLTEINDALKKATGAVDGLTDSVEKASESITNIPNIFKVALARFEAGDTLPGSGSGGAPVPGPTGAGGGGGGGDFGGRRRPGDDPEAGGGTLVYVQNMTIDARDKSPAEIYDGMEAEARRRGLVRDGTTATPFARAG